MIVQRKTRGPLVVMPVIVVLGEFNDMIVAAPPLICNQVPVPGAAMLAAMVVLPGVEQIDWSLPASAAGAVAVKAITTSSVEAVQGALLIVQRKV